MRNAGTGDLNGLINPGRQSPDRLRGRRASAPLVPQAPAVGPASFERAWSEDR
jgi:hypothetical protein